MVEKQVGKTTRGNGERNPKRPNSRDFAEIGLRETIQHYMPNPGRSHFDYYRYYTQKRDRRLVIAIHIKDGVSYEEAKEKILNGIKAAFQSDCKKENAAEKKFDIAAIENLDLREDFKEFLRRLRKSHLLTQAEMAKKLGMSRDYMSRLEGGRKPGLRFLKRLVEEFELSVEDLHRKV